MAIPTEKMLKTVEFINNRFGLSLTQEMYERYNNLDFEDFDSVSDYIDKYFEKAKAIKSEPKSIYDKKPIYNEYREYEMVEKYPAKFEMGYGYDD